MLSFLRKLLWKGPATLTPVEPGLIAVPANIPVPANDPTPQRVELVSTRTVLRHSRNNMLVLAGTTVLTTNNVTMQVARIEQKPPYVICIHKGRRIAVRPDTISCYWAEHKEPIQ